MITCKFNKEKLLIEKWFMGNPLFRPNLQLKLIAFFFIKFRQIKSESNK